MTTRIAALVLILMAPRQGVDPPDPNGEPAAGRRSLGFRVFRNMDRPITGAWDLVIPEWASRRVELREVEPGKPGALVGVDAASGEPLMRLNARKAGIGYDGELAKVLAACGLDTVSITEFLPLGDAIVLRFESRPTNVPCSPIDSGAAGKHFVVSTRGGPVRLRDFSEISSARSRETYSIGGERQVETSYEIPFGSVSLEHGTEVRFLQRVKAPLDNSYWFEVEALLAPEAGVEPPKGYLAAESLRVVGSLTLRRIRTEPEPGS